MSKRFIKLIISSILLITSVLYFSSCSQNTPEINNINYSIVFDYSDEDSLPESRLCIFAETNSDVRRTEQIIVESLETGYIWNINDIINTEYENIQWCGNTNLVVPANKMIPKGKYRITLINADEKQTDIVMNINYDEEFYNLKSDDVENEMVKINGNRRTAIYDQDGVLIYYGDRTEDLQTTRDIWNQFREADCYNDIWSTPGQFLICIMPSVQIQSELQLEKNNIEKEEIKD